MVSLEAGIGSRVSISTMSPRRPDLAGLFPAGVRLWLLALALACSLPSMAKAAGAENRQAVLLRDTVLLPPADTVGTGLEPEVKVSVSIDDRGRVSRVEVLSVRPASEYDDLFRRHTMDELMRWRYAPALEDGTPVAETRRWTVQYRARESRTEVSSASEIPLPGFLVARENAAARHERMMSLPLEVRKKFLLSYSEIAEKHLIRERRQQYSTESFVVVSDSDSADLAKIVAHNLEVALSLVHGLLAPSIESQPSDLKRIVYLYSHSASFEAMRAELLPLTREKATYYPPGLITYHLELPSSDYLLSFLIHEACHGYSDHELTRSGLSLPSWLEEGFAEYMGNSQVKKGQLLPGRTLKRELVLNHQVGVLNTATKAGWDLARVKQALRTREAPTLEEVVTADRGIFYGTDAHLYYGMSWLLVHFLRHGEPQWAEESFPAMMLYLAEGYPAGAAVETAYGRDLASLEEPFLKYARQF